MTGGTRGDHMLMGRMVAGVELLGRTGVGEVEIAYDDDRNDEIVPVTWWCGGNWKGTRMFSEHFPYPAQAVEDLLGRVVNGGMCARCKRTSVVGVAPAGSITCPDVHDWPALVSCLSWPGPLIMRVIRCESGGRPDATNGKHHGLMQIANGPYEPEANIRLGYSMFVRRGLQPWYASRRCWA